MNTRKRTLASGLSLMILLSFASENAFSEGMNFLPPKKVELLKLLPPPPLPESAAQKRDMAELLEIQKNRTPAQVALAEADNVLSMWRYADVLGPDFKAEKLPVSSKFFNRMQADARVLLLQTKDGYARPRPSTINPEVIPLGGQVRAPYIYPSGTTLYGWLGAIVLSNMVPEKQRELFDRGYEFSANRVVLGVHYTSDLIVGQMAATVLAAAFFETPGFMKEYEAARAELRSVLGLGEPNVASRPEADDDIVTGSVKPKTDATAK